MLSDLSTAPWFRRLLVAAIMLGILTLTYVILQPFIIPVIWAGILKIATVPAMLILPFTSKGSTPVSLATRTIQQHTDTVRGN